MVRFRINVSISISERVIFTVRIRVRLGPLLGLGLHLLKLSFVPIADRPPIYAQT